MMMKKRLTALLLTAVMVVGILPTTVLASDDGITALSAVTWTADDASRDYSGTVTASAPSYQAASGANSLAAALDGDPGTWYHSAWNTTNGDGGAGPTDLTNAPNNRYIQLTLAETTPIMALRYLPRAVESTNSDYGNGVITEYAVKVSTTGTADADFTEVATGTWAVSGNDTWHVAAFDVPAYAKYVRLYGVHTYGNGTNGTGTNSNSDKFLSAAEIRLVQAGDPANLARLEGVEASALNCDSTSHTADKAIDNDTTTTRWATETEASASAPQWLQLDLHRRASISSVTLLWEQTSVTAYTLQVSNDGQTWSTVHTSNTRPTRDSESVITATETITLDTPVIARYIKVNITAFDDQGSASWASASLFDFAVNGYAGALIEDVIPDTPIGNLCRPATCDPADTATRVTASASTTENGNVTAAKAIDGGFTNGAAGDANVERWASATSSANPPTVQWLQVDLGVLRTVSVVKIFWQHDSVTAYTVQVSANGTTWETVKEHPSGRITGLNETITFAARSARYVKVNITGYDNQGSARWGNVSIWELEVYNELPHNAAWVMDNLTAASFEVVNNTLQLKSDVDVAGHTVTFAANLEQIVTADGSVHQPLVDTLVDLDVTVTKGDDTVSTSPQSPIRVTIPGVHTANEGNPKPAVIPEIMEWYSSAAQNGQNFALASTGGVIHAGTGLSAVANELKDDIKDLFGVDYTVSIDDEASPATGDFRLTLENAAAHPHCDAETYHLTVTDAVSIRANDPVGVYWGTRTALQALKLSGDDMTIPQGTARDYPEFKVRGFVLDVGRKPFSMEILRKMAKNMAWYKLNDFHVHLNDNLIFMEDYGVNGENYTDPDVYAQANDAYSAFRMESDIEVESGANPLSAKDYHYSKAEFKQFIKDSAAMGVNIVPEFDAPAHAKAIADAFPSLRLQCVWGGQWGYNHPANCHLDLINKYDESLAKVQEIFDEYLNGSDPVFSGSVVDFGADEYFGGGTPYRRFMRDMIAYVKGKGYTPRLWGSLSHSMIASSDAALQFNDTSLNQGVQLNIWNTSWANPQAMYNKGFSLINTTDNPFYMVPNGSGGRGDYGYGDYLNLTNIYAKSPNDIGGTWFPASSPQILGEAFAIWNDDNTDTHASGLDEVDIFDRFFDTLPVVSVRMWGEGNELDRDLDELQDDAATIGCAPGTNPHNEVALTVNPEHVFDYDFEDTADKSGNGYDLTLVNASLKSGALILGGVKGSYAETGLNKLGTGNSLSFTVYKRAGTDTQVIFETDHIADGSKFAYNEYAIKAIPVEGDPTKWKLGFTRELYDYEFDVELPADQWVKLTLTNDVYSARLSVNNEPSVAAVGRFLSNESSNTPFLGTTNVTLSTLQLPIARIGSKNAVALDGFLKDVYTGVASDAPTSALSATAPSFNNDGLPQYALDGNPATMYHSNWNSDVNTNGPRDLTNDAANRYLQLDIATPATVTGLRYLPREGAGNGTVTGYEVKVSTDGVTYTSVSTGTWTASDGWKTATAFAAQPNVTSVRLYGTTSNSLISAAEIDLQYTIALTSGNTDVTVGKVTWGEDSAEPELSVTLTPSGVLLTEGVDYEVELSDNTAAGAGTAAITGIGNYTGSVSASFTVPAKPIKTDIADTTRVAVTLPKTVPYTGSAICPDPVIVVDGTDTLVNGLEYAVTYESNTALGTATATITGKGNYTGTVTKEFAIVRCPIDDVEVTGIEASYPATGRELHPVPVVTLGGKTLRNNTDYAVTYGANTEPGTGTVEIRGINNYTGTKRVEFTITERETIDLSDPAKATATLGSDSYELSGGKAEPEPIVRYGGVTLLKGVDYTVTYQNNTAPGTGVLVVTGKGAYSGSITLTFTVTGTVPSGGSSGGGGGGGGGSSSRPSTTTTTSKTEDATVTTTTDKTTGAVISEATYSDGVKVTSEINAVGGVTAMVTVPTGTDKATVVIPTKTAPTLGQVAVIIHPDGTEEIVKTSFATEEGMQVTLSGDATIQIIDNTKEFIDVADDSWAKESITFVTSREIFNGTGSGTFTPDSDMSRAMVCTVLANLSGVETKGGETWYEKAVDWAKDKGVSDGKNPNEVITREQLAVMLYRYTGSPTVESDMGQSFSDLDQVSDWAEIAMIWAVRSGLIKGRNGTELAPKCTATRAEVAVIFQRYMSLGKK